MKRPEWRLAHRLAFHWGRASVNDMLGEMTATQWADWSAFVRAEPFGAPADDMRLGYLISSLFGMLTGKHVPVDQVTPQWRRGEQPWQEMFQIIQRQADAHRRKD